MIKEKKISAALDNLSIDEDYIEGGWPTGANPTDTSFLTKNIILKSFKINCIWNDKKI